MPPIAVPAPAPAPKPECCARALSLGPAFAVTAKVDIVANEGADEVGIEANDGADEVASEETDEVTNEVARKVADEVGLEVGPELPAGIDAISTLQVEDGNITTRSSSVVVLACQSVN